ncbi:MAG: GYF domain-containing protein [bacterium]
MKYYYTNTDNEPVGPVEEKQLRQLYIDGEIEGSAWAIEEGGNEWQSLLSLLTGQPKPPPNLPPPPPPRPSTIRSSSPPFRSPTKMEEAIRVAKKLRDEFSPSSKPIKSLQPQPPTKPRVIHLIALLSVASGAASLSWGFGLIAFGLHIFFIGVIFTIIPALCCLLLGSLNIIYGMKLFFSMPTPPAKHLAVCDVASILVFNLIACVFGVINLTLYKEEVVVQYFKTNSADLKKI